MHLKENKNLSYTLYSFSSFYFLTSFIFIDNYTECNKAMSPLHPE